MADGFDMSGSRGVATCPTCGSDDVNHQEPSHYLRTGRECHDAFHADADLRGEQEA